MARKSKTVGDELKKAQMKAQEIERLYEAVKKEETKLLDETTEKINELCEENNLFCGVVLSTNDLLGVIQLAIESKENISIPFKLYHKE